MLACLEAPNESSNVDIEAKPVDAAPPLCRNQIAATMRGLKAAPRPSCPVVLVAVAIAAASIGSGAGSAALGEPRAATARPVLLVPLGGFSRSDATRLARSLSGRLGVGITVLPRAPLPASAFNRTRKQFVAEKLIAFLQRRRPAGSREAAVIGLTDEDMYIRAEAWRYAFSLRSFEGFGFAVVSRARMDPRFLGLTPDPALRRRRLEKMVLKNIGLFVLGQQLSRDPRSVMYRSILSLDDLDYMTLEFRPTPSRAQSTWLAQAGRVCERGIAEGKALIARSSIVTPVDFLAFARESIAIEARHRRQLAAIPAAPEDRAAVGAMLARLRRSGSADRAALAKLSASWSEETLRRWLQGGIRFTLALKADALELGSRACGRYFDPVTYTR